MPYFSSSAIRRAEYDESSKTLSVWFVPSGGPYYYYGVPSSVFAGLLNASSKGTYFNEFIRDHYAA